VTLDTLRIIYVSRGLKVLAASIGFIEVLIWLFAITQIFKNLTNPIYYVAYAGGFAMGNYVGIFIEEKMAVGTVVIRTITQKDASVLIKWLKTEGYGVTHIDAQGALGPVKLFIRSSKEEIFNTSSKLFAHAIPWHSIPSKTFVPPARESSRLLNPVRTNIKSHSHMPAHQSGS